MKVFGFQQKERAAHQLPLKLTPKHTNNAERIAFQK